MAEHAGPQGEVAFPLRPGDRMHPCRVPAGEVGGHVGAERVRRRLAAGHAPAELESRPGEPVGDLVNRSRERKPCRPPVLPHHHLGEVAGGRAGNATWEAPRASHEADPSESAGRLPGYCTMGSNSTG